MLLRFKFPLINLNNVSVNSYAYRNKPEISVSACGLFRVMLLFSHSWQLIKQSESLDVCAHTNIYQPVFVYTVDLKLHNTTYLILKDI